jgi:hypothetical protein
MEAAGLNGELVQKVISSRNNRLGKKIVNLIRNGDSAPITNQKRAREIMGLNFFGIEEVVKHFGINPSPEEYAVLALVPYSEAVLENSKNTHVLVAVFPLSINEIREKVSVCHRDLFTNSIMYDPDKKHIFTFLHQKCEIGWRLVCKTHLPNSEFKRWNKKMEGFAEEDEVPSANVLTFAIIGHYLVTGERMLKDVYVYTSTINGYTYISAAGDRIKFVGDRVNLKFSDDYGLNLEIGDPVGQTYAPYIGVVTSRKPNHL